MVRPQNPQKFGKVSKAVIEVLGEVELVFLKQEEVENLVRKKIGKVGSTSVHMALTRLRDKKITESRHDSWRLSKSFKSQSKDGE